MKQVYEIRILIILFIFISVFSLKSQEVIATGGDFFENGDASVSFTIGEPVTDYLIGDSYNLTQGFQQSTLTIITHIEEETKDISVSVYPNPSHEYLKIRTDYQDEMKYQLFSFNGELLDEGHIMTIETKVDMSKYLPAMYIVRIMDGGDYMSSIKIVKQ